MGKTLYSRHNVIFLKLLRRLRESQQLRQSDLAVLLGRSQGTVSKVERGERRLDVIELRDWVTALDTNFTRFVGRLDAELRSQGISDLRVRQVNRALRMRLRGASRRRVQRTE